MAKVLTGDDRILSKIRALLDKAQSTDSPQERDSCMRKAQELMQNNHIEQERVTSYEQIQEEGVEECFIFYEEEHEMILMNSIARNNFCKIILLGKEYVTPKSDMSNYKVGADDVLEKRNNSFYINKLSIIGEPTNVNLCLYMYSFYRNSVLRMVMSSYSKFLVEQEIESLGIKLHKGHKDKFVKNYLIGCVDGISELLTEQRIYAEKQYHQLKGLVLTKKNKIDEYVKKHYPNLSYSRRSNQVSSEKSLSYKSGFSDGKNSKYHAGVEKGNKGYIG